VSTTPPEIEGIVTPLEILAADSWVNVGVKPARFAWGASAMARALTWELELLELLFVAPPMTRSPTG
jgi:hypothetical protein